MISAQKGFTLVELLVVISIIAILSVIGITVFGGVQKSARDARRRGDLDAISKALEIYKGQNGEYPPIGNTNWCTYISNSSSPDVKNALANSFAGGSIPGDPARNGKPGDYYYAKLTSGFELLASLEGLPQLADPHAIVTCKGGGYWETGNTGGWYNYKVTNQQ